MSIRTGAFDFLSERMVPAENLLPYSSGVLLGHWQAIQDWNSTLRAQRLRLGDCRAGTQPMLENPVPLALPTDYVPIGANVMLLATDTYGWPARTCGDNALALVVDAYEDASPVACSRNVTPCERSVFIVDAERGDGSARDLAYGQRFVLRPALAQTLSLRCEIPTLDTILGGYKHPTLRLCDRTDRYCVWTAWPSHPRLRVEAEGSATPAHSKLVIRHEASGRCLAAETGHWGWSALGRYECEASVHSVLDTHNKETEPNFWAFIVQKPAEIVTPAIPSDRCP